MADAKISQLPAAAALAGTEVAPIVQSAATVKATVQDIKDLAATKYAIASTGIITEAGTTRTLAAGDNGKVIYFTSGSAITVNTASGLGAGFSCMLVQGGAGQITVSQGAGTTLASWGALVKTAGQYAGVSILCPVANTFVLMGQTV
jgi:hypothetical protein